MTSLSPSADSGLPRLLRAALRGERETADAVRSLGLPEVEASLHAAAVLGDAERVRLCLDADPGSVDAELGPGRTPLLLACHTRYPESESERAGLLAAVRLLIARGADTAASARNDLPGGRATPLTGAAGHRGDVQLVDLLLDAGVPPNIGVALFAALGRGKLDCAERLMRAGADVNAPDVPGTPRETGAPGGTGAWRPLHWMLDLAFDPQAVAFALAQGADPNLPGPFGETALHVAVRRRRTPMIAVLAEAGAELDARTRLGASGETPGITAYRHAVRRPFPECARELERLGADTQLTDGDRLAIALLERDTDRARALLDAQPELARDMNSDEARIVADLASQGKVAEMLLLLDAGADITSRGLDGGTPLHSAAWFGQLESAQALIERGAPLDLHGDLHDSSPLGWTAHGSRFGDDGTHAERYAAIAAALLEAGAPLPEPGDGNASANLLQARPEVVRVLERFGWRAPG